MFRMTSYLAAPAFVVLMSGTAHAALTVDQVWQSWKDAGALAGLNVTAATEVNDGGVLTLNGVSIVPEGESSGLTISDMVLTEQSDGSVTITPGADIGVDLAGEGSSGSLKLTHDGLELTASEGEGGGLVYDYAAAALNVVYDTAYAGAMPAAEGAEAVQAVSKGSVGFTDLAGSYTDTPGENRTFGLDLTAGKLAYDTLSEDASMELKTTAVSETSDVEMSFDVAMPTTMSLLQIASATDFGTALQEGLSITMATKQGASVGSTTQESPYMPMAMKINAGPGEATGAFNKDVFSIQSQGEGLDLEVTSGMMPVPVKITSGPVVVGMTSPVMSGDVAGDYGLQFKLSQFTVNEEAWAMIDPGAALKRDPADLSIDVSGKTKIDFIAMAAADESGAPPVMPAPETLNITDLTLKVAGAAFTGTGAFTFDNTMGMPMPLGEANVSLTGGNALIDGLIATGVVTEEDAMGARMMMGAFMSPGAGPDELTSKIEAKAGGEIYVNGQRVQ
jgi:Uncharacterized protein conserved in bacteria (DUF2125)